MYAGEDMKKWHHAEACFGNSTVLQFESVYRKVKNDRHLNKSGEGNEYFDNHLVLLFSQSPV